MSEVTSIDMSAPFVKDGVEYMNITHAIFSEFFRSSSPCPLEHIDPPSARDLEDPKEKADKEYWDSIPEGW